MIDVSDASDTETCGEVGWPSGRLRSVSLQTQVDGSPGKDSDDQRVARVLACDAKGTLVTELCTQ